MKKFLLLASATMISAPAFAADVVMEEPPAPVVMEVPATRDWSGLYVGLQAGYGFGDDGQVELSPFTPALVGPFTPAGAPVGSSFNANGDFDDGFVGGAHIGYDQQYGKIVLGGILDINYTDLGDEQRAFSRSPAEYVVERDLDYLATLRGRLGYAFNDRFMAYATGGLAYGQVDFNYRQGAASPASTVSTSGGQDSDFGYTVGGGIEMRATDKISFGLEYLYTNLGGNDYSANLQGGPFGGVGGAAGTNPGGTTLVGSDDDFDFHTIQAKVSYRF
ncbi:porin family protein [Tianweitania sp. BSSL-BM11]|uniref:Porin family protein n=1 Tax=Tianweitania aestuarii TaxID=2814886 RepID=A0ABS5S1H8_9HYPH|nr:outer membrane protein [Tianweitania aestuarii]MBS9722386.1 porin family protein [Tianweitania aestuarii]